MLWLQSSMITVAQELWYSLCATIRSPYSTSMAPVVDCPWPCSRWTALRMVLLGSRFMVSPNS
jgi:hypothetical protein